MFRRAVITLLAIGLAGCRADIPPADSADVIDGGLLMGEFVMQRSGRPPEAWTLDNKQVMQLNLWLQNHRDGWNMIVASPPPPSFSVVLTHPDKTHSRIDLFDINENWKHVIIVHAASAADNGMRALSTEEREELLAILKKNS